MYCGTEVTELLISNGADIYPEDKNLYTPIDEAVERGHKDIVKLFISKGINLNIQNSIGITPLHIASQKYDEEIFYLIISHGADVNKKTLSGQWTPLHYAAEKGNSKFTKALLNAHAFVNPKDVNGRTPLHYAVDCGKESWSKIVGDCLEPIEKERERKVQDFSETVRLLLSKGADVNVRDNDGKTPLDYSANSDISTILRRHGAKE